MNSHHLKKNTLWSGLARCCFIALATVSMMLVTTTAQAACGSHVGTRSPIASKLWSLANPAGGQTNDYNSIVGLWHVTYMADGQLFYEAFDLWHSDGTEMETANFSPIEGNVCIGVWKKVGPLVHLNHVGWQFDGSGNPAGTFTLTENNAVSGDGNSYAGTFDYKAYDPNGTLQQEIKGTLAATRIGAN